MQNIAIRFYHPEKKIKISKIQPSLPILSQFLFDHYMSTTCNAKKQHTKQLQLHTSKPYEAIALCRYWLSCKYFLNSVCSQYKQLWTALHALVIVYGSCQKNKTKMFLTSRAIKNDFSKSKSVDLNDLLSTPNPFQFKKNIESNS